MHTTVVKESVYVCPDCSKEFKSISGFRGHVMNNHDKNLKGILHLKIVIIAALKMQALAK